MVFAHRLSTYISAEKMRMYKNKVNEAMVEELEPMHQEAEKIYNHLAGHQTEKMMCVLFARVTFVPGSHFLTSLYRCQQSIMVNALEEHYETLHSAKHHMSSERKRLQVGQPPSRYQSRY